MWHGNGDTGVGQMAIYHSVSAFLLEDLRPKVRKSLSNINEKTV